MWNGQILITLRCYLHFVCGSLIRLNNQDIIVIDINYQISVHCCLSLSFQYFFKAFMITIASPINSSCCL